jgi:phosphate transport system substrate-binding protein
MPLVLTGAGSTFDVPFFQRAFAAYTQHYGVAINYRAVGSGAGIQQFIDNAVDFGASDVPMNQLEQSLAMSTGGPVVEIPIALGGVAIAYNEPKVVGKHPLQLDGSTLAAIFLGQITYWDDPAIARLNPGVRLPPDRIEPVHRQDSSGTTYIFTNYLAQVSHAWAMAVGTGKSVAWPVGAGGMGSPGVASWLARHEGSIGYVELNYAIDNHIPYASMKNAAGVFVAPTLASVTAAAAQFPHFDAGNFSIVNAPGAASYPIAGYSWVLLRVRQADPAVGDTLVRLFHWLTTTGQTIAGQLNYAPLPPVAQQRASTGLNSIVVS